MSVPLVLKATFTVASERSQTSELGFRVLVQHNYETDLPGFVFYTVARHWQRIRQPSLETPENPAILWLERAYGGQLFLRRMLPKPSADEVVSAMLLTAQLAGVLGVRN